MNQVQFGTACQRTAGLLLRECPNVVAQRDAPDAPDSGCSVPHLYWMIGVAEEHYFAGKVEKANRWLGYVQGAMAAQRFASLEELKRANMPDGETFDGRRV